MSKLTAVWKLIPAGLKKQMIKQGIKLALDFDSIYENSKTRTYNFSGRKGFSDTPQMISSMITSPLMGAARVVDGMLPVEVIPVVGQIEDIVLDSVRLPGVIAQLGTEAMYRAWSVGDSISKDASLFNLVPKKWKSQAIKPQSKVTKSQKEVRTWENPESSTKTREKVFIPSINPDQPVSPVR